MLETPMMTPALSEISARAATPGPATLAILGNIGPMEYVIIVVVMLLIFGRRLPEVGRSLGRGIIEFKKGLKGVEDEIETASNEPRPGATNTRAEAEKSDWVRANEALPGSTPNAAGAAGAARTPVANTADPRVSRADNPGA